MEEWQIQRHVMKLRESDRDSFRAIVEYFHKSIFNFLLFRVNDAAVAEDLLQETFIRLWEHRQSLNETLSIKSWLFTTASNLSLNHIRHEKVILKFRDGQEHERVITETPYYELEYQELTVAIENAMAKMTDKVRMAFLLCRVEGLSYREAAERLQVTTATIESHMVKGLRIIREELDNYNKDTSRLSGGKVY